jgi:hypothetical protein
MFAWLQEASRRAAQANDKLPGAEAFDKAAEMIASEADINAGMEEVRRQVKSVKDYDPRSLLSSSCMPLCATPYLPPRRARSRGALREADNTHARQERSHPSNAM